MRFKAKEIKEYKHGETREYEKFAWLPKKSTDGYWYWLETVTITEKYVSNCPSHLWQVVDVAPIAMERYL